MSSSFSDLSDPVWTAPLVQALLRASTAITRLEERISASPVRRAWLERACWQGYARALQGQGVEIEEIDIFSVRLGLPLPSRPPLSTANDPLAVYAEWRDRFAERERHHWTDKLPFSFIPPEEWSERPPLLRALELHARWARADRSINAWLELPFLLRRVGASTLPLPLLVTGDKALRIGEQDRDILIRRYLKRCAKAAEEGLHSLRLLEQGRRHMTAFIAGERRPGALASLGALFMVTPLLTPKGVMERLGLTLSGAGKLLERAAAGGLCREISGRQSWRLYLAPDLAIRYGFREVPRGRPALSSQDSSGVLEDSLQAFDAELAKFDKIMARFASIEDEERDGGDALLGW